MILGISSFLMEVNPRTDFQCHRVEGQGDTTSNCIRLCIYLNMWFLAFTLELGQLTGKLISCLRVYPAPVLSCWGLSNSWVSLVLLHFCLCLGLYFQGWYLVSGCLLAFLFFFLPIPFAWWIFHPYFYLPLLYLINIEKMLFPAFFPLPTENSIILVTLFCWQ